MQDANASQHKPHSDRHHGTAADACRAAQMSPTSHDHAEPEPVLSTHSNTTTGRRPDATLNDVERKNGSYKFHPGRDLPNHYRQQPDLNCTTSKIDRFIMVPAPAPQPRSDVQPSRILPVQNSEGKFFSTLVHCTTYEFTHYPGQNALTLSLPVQYSRRMHERLQAP